MSITNSLFPECVFNLVSFSKQLKISTAQFEHRSGDKVYNLSIIEKLSRKASSEGSDIITFHECAITGYTYARELSREQMLEISEFVPNRESITALTDIAREYNIVVLWQDFLKRIPMIVCYVTATIFPENSYRLVDIDI